MYLSHQNGVIDTQKQNEEYQKHAPALMSTLTTSA